MESVPDMLRPLHFVFLFAILAFAAAAENEKAPANEVEGSQNAGTSDLEADATYWGYGRPWGGYSGWGGYGGRGLGYGYPWGGYYGGGYYGRGWGGRGWGGRGWGLGYY